MSTSAQVHAIASPASSVVVVSEVFPPRIGGSGRLMYEIYSRFGQPVTILTDGDETELSQRGSLDVQVLALAGGWGVTSPTQALSHLRAARIVRQHGSTGIVHCCRALPEGLLAGLAQLTGGAPYLCWAHGEELAYARTSRELEWLTRRVYAQARAVIANSRNTASLVEEFGVPAERLHVVHPGVDVARYRPRTRKPDTSADGRPEFRMLSVGRLEHRKGHDLVIEAMAVLRDEFPDLRYHIVGDGPERTTLEQQIVRLNLSDVVTLLGAVSEQHLQVEFGDADLFILPTRQEPHDFEGFGIVFLEAAAAGLAVIAGRSGGVAEAVEHGRTGMVLDAVDVPAVTHAVRQMVLDGEQRAAMGRAGRRRTEREFTWDHAAARVRDIHAACLSEAAVRA